MVSSRQASANASKTRERKNTTVKDTSSWLTRHEASATLSLSEQTLASYERRGLLHPEYTYRRDVHNIDRRVVVYDPQELTRLRPYRPYKHRAVAQRDPGESAARAFEMFREGRSEEEVVVELRLDPDAVCALHDKWLQMSRSDLVISPNAKTALEKVVGPFADVTELIEKLQKRLESPSDVAPAPKAPVAPARRWVAEILDTGTSSLDVGAAAVTALGTAVEPSGADATSAPQTSTTDTSANEESTGQGADSARGIRAVGSQRERLLDEWLKSLNSDDTRLQRLAGLLKREELELLAELERGIGMEAVATKDSRSPREQLLDVLLVTFTADAARLAEIGAILSASELDMLARLRGDCCESQTAADGAPQ